MGQYYDLIMEPVEGSFSQYFNMFWNSQLDDFIKPYSDAIQLRIGNQLRPKLTCWGAAFNTHSAEELDLQKLAEIAAQVEMVHKASLIIDDMVDGDVSRRGQSAFHVQFGQDQAILFAIALLSRGMSGINQVLSGSAKHFQSLTLYSDTISRMALGCLEELEMNAESRFDREKILRIIDLETITLIKNSFLLGYWSNYSGNLELETSLVEIGENCGYIFQLLNDLEPFSGMEQNCDYKGGRNIDIDRNRKNIVVATIFGAATAKERAMLTKLSGPPLRELIVQLYGKYAVYETVCAEARKLEQQIYRQIQTLTGAQRNCLEDFCTFVHDVIAICFSRLR